MKNPKAKKSSKRTAAEEIVDQAAQRLAEILVQLVDEQNAAKTSPARVNLTG